MWLYLLGDTFHPMTARNASSKGAELAPAGQLHRPQQALVPVPRDSRRGESGSEPSSGLQHRPQAGQSWKPGHCLGWQWSQEQSAARWPAWGSEKLSAQAGARSRSCRQDACPGQSARSGSSAGGPGGLGGVQCSWQRERGRVPFSESISR